MKEKYINSIIKIVKDVFSTMIMLDPKDSIPFNKNKLKLRSEITGIMGLTGNVTMSVLTHFEKAVALKVTSNMLGMEYNEIDGDVTDAIGEISNMVAGGMKAEIANIVGEEMALSLPLVIQGKDFEIPPINEMQPIVIPFEVECGKFYIEFSYKDK
jgi:chemotaxis protein CheX